MYTQALCAEGARGSGRMMTSAFRELGLEIDASRVGGLGRFLNHKKHVECNCVSQRWISGGLVRTCVSMLTPSGYSSHPPPPSHPSSARNCRTPRCNHLVPKQPVRVIFSTRRIEAGEELFIG